MDPNRLLQEAAYRGRSEVRNPPTRNRTAISSTVHQHEPVVKGRQGVAREDSIEAADQVDAYQVDDERVDVERVDVERVDVERVGFKRCEVEVQGTGDGRGADANVNSTCAEKDCMEIQRGQIQRRDAACGVFDRTEDALRWASGASGRCGGPPPRDKSKNKRSDKSDVDLPVPVHRYIDGRSYIVARGRDSVEPAVVDSRPWQHALAVLDLRNKTPSVDEFMRVVVRELRIRNYRPHTVSSYRSAVESFLRWSGRMPHQIDREMVREYLEYLVDSENGASMLSVHLAAIRTVFDKFCFLDVTLGLQTPRRGKRRPVILSKNEVTRLLQAAVSYRDKLLLGLAYATGMRVSEVVRLMWRDIDLDRNVISIRHGKGDADRQVSLPETYRQLFARMGADRAGTEYMFPSESSRRGKCRGESAVTRHLSARTFQRAMQKAIRIAGIRKHATPHSLRHAFATHSFEDGCDIRRIQKILGHVHLETTTIYVHVARPADPSTMPSPIDRLEPKTPRAMFAAVSPLSEPQVHTRKFAKEEETRCTLEYRGRRGKVFLTGIRAKESRPGFWEIQIPHQEQWRHDIEKLDSCQRASLDDARLYEWLRAQIATQLQSDVDVDRGGRHARAG
tara:strand:- start:74974 stop:76836 length:1863 start_codon:yes stop_codon:yes gene_type:complete